MHILHPYNVWTAKRVKQSPFCVCHSLAAAFFCLLVVLVHVPYVHLFSSPNKKCSWKPIKIGGCLCFLKAIWYFFSNLEKLKIPSLFWHLCVWLWHETGQRYLSCLLPDITNESLHTWKADMQSLVESKDYQGSLGSERSVSNYSPRIKHCCREALKRRNFTPLLQLLCKQCAS